MFHGSYVTLDSVSFGFWILHCTAHLHSSAFARTGIINPIQNEQHCRNRRPSQTPSHVTRMPPMKPKFLPYRILPPAEVLCFALHTECRRHHEDGGAIAWWKFRELSPPAEGHTAQEERTGGTAKFSFKQTGLVSLPCRFFWLLSSHQNLKSNCSSGICLQVIPASRPYPPTRRQACWRL